MTTVPRRTFLGAMAAGLAACSANKFPAADSTLTASTNATTNPTTGSTSAMTGATVTAAPTTAITVAPTPSVTLAGAPARFLNKGDRGSGAVALTFHAAGRVDMANRLLDVIKRTGIPVTIFAVGEWIQANPQLAKRIALDDHELANHTWSHGAMRTMTAAQLDTEVTKAASALVGVSGSQGRWFRPSQIEVPTDAILAAAGRAGYGLSVGYDVDSMDFQDPGAAAVRKNVIDNAQPGSIISLHFDHTDTIDALPAIVDHLQAKNWRAVTLSQMFPA